MKTNLRYFLILMALVCVISPLAAIAQKKKIPVDKPISSAQIPTDDKTKHQNSPSLNFSSLELAVVEQINVARRDPQKFVMVLEEYRKAMNGNLISLPGRTPLRTVEGAPVIEEGITELKAVTNLSAIEISEKLSEAARMQLRDLQEDASLGHKGKNGSTLKTRLAQFVTVEGKSAENISYRSKEARDVVASFLMDDGVKSRMHRRNVLSPKYKKVGVACGLGKNNEPLCVTVFAESYKNVGSASKHIEF